MNILYQTDTYRPSSNEFEDDIMAYVKTALKGKQPSKVIIVLQAGAVPQIRVTYPVIRYDKPKPEGFDLDALVEASKLRLQSWITASAAKHKSEFHFYCREQEYSKIRKAS